MWSISETLIQQNNSFHSTSDIMSLCSELQEQLERQNRETIEKTYGIKGLKLPNFVFKNYS